MAAKVKSMTKAELVNHVAGVASISKTAARSAIEGLVEAIGIGVAAGKRVSVSGLGTFVVRNRPARMGRNPQTGESIKIKASKKVAYRMAKQLKESI